MKRTKHFRTVTLGAASALALLTTAATAQNAPKPAATRPGAGAKPGAAAPKPSQQQAEMAAMMERAKAFTQPSKFHKVLERFLGTWKTETRFFMGAKPGPAELGTAEFTWQMEGRWLKSEARGKMMGRPLEVLTLFGYDNFKQSFVMTTMSNMDTAMNHAEGDLDPTGKSLLLYGTLDEYLTGEHDKMVKYAYRFQSPKRIVLEVHDLPIGEVNTKVVEIVFTR